MFQSIDTQIDATIAAQASEVTQKVESVSSFPETEARNIVIEPSQRGGLEILKDIDNYPLILDTLGCADSYEIVGIYRLLPKPTTR